MRPDKNKRWKSGFGGVCAKKMEKLKYNGACVGGREGVMGTQRVRRQCKIMQMVNLVEKPSSTTLTQR